MEYLTNTEERRLGRSGRSEVWWRREQAAALARPTIGVVLGWFWILNAGPTGVPQLSKPKIDAPGP